MSTHTLVIGGTRGLGRAVVRALTGRGQVVSTVGRKAPVAPEEGVRYWQADIADPVQRSAVLEQILSSRGRLSHLVFVQRFRGDGDSWEGEWHTSLSATKAMLERCAGEFDGQGGNAVVMVGSIASRFVVGEQPVAYHVAKAAIEQLVRYYAVALGPRGIRVNCVSPASFLKEESREFYERQPALLDLYRRLVPLGRMGTAEEVAGVVAFLCSTDAAFITGQTIVVDGGVSLLGQESLARRLVLPDDRDALRRD